MVRDWDCMAELMLEELGRGEEGMYNVSVGGWGGWWLWGMDVCRVCDG